MRTLHIVSASLIVALVTASLPFFTKPKPAVAAGEFSASELVSNSVFLAKDSMTVDQIQLFLEQKGSVLAVIQSSYLGEGAGGRSAAQIIYDSARASVSGFGSAGRPSNPFNVSLNPQAILTTLQKETSLITGNYTIGSETLNNMLRIAMGYGCPDSGGCDDAYAGFTNQVYYGSAQLWLSYWRSNTNHASALYRVGQTYTFSNAIYAPYCTSASSNVTIANAATASLYAYTPHVCNGNANFWRLMNNWFPQKINAFTRDVRLVKGSGPDAFVYWPAYNLRWYVPNWGVLADWGITAQLETIPDNALNAIQRSGGSLSRLIRAEGSPDVYFMQNGYKRYLRSYASLKDYGVVPSDIRTIEPEVMNQYREGLPLGSLVGGIGSPDIFLATAGRRHYINSWYTIGNWGFAASDVRWIEPVILDTWPQSTSIEWLIKGEYHPDAFLVSDSQRHYIPSADLLRHWGLAGVEIKVVGNDAADQLPRGKDLTRVARGSNTQVYYIENGRKRPVHNASRLGSVGASISSLVRVSDPILDRLPTGPAL